MKEGGTRGGAGYFGAKEGMEGVVMERGRGGGREVREEGRGGEEDERRRERGERR